MDENIKARMPFDFSAQGCFFEGHTLPLYEKDGSYLTGIDLGPVVITVDARQAKRVAALTTELRLVADRIDEHAQAFRLANPVDVEDLSRCPVCGDENSIDEVEAGACGRCGAELGRAGLALTYPTTAELDAVVNAEPVDA